MTLVSKRETSIEIDFLGEKAGNNEDKNLLGPGWLILFLF